VVLTWEALCAQVHQDLKPENCMVDLETRTLKVRPALL